MKKTKKPPKFERNGGVTFFSAMPAWVYYDGALYRVDSTVAKAIVEGDYFVTTKKPEN